MKEKESEDILEVRYEYRGEYLVSYGETSKFFREVLLNKQLYGSQCPSCRKVWMPPREHCSDCYVETQWVPFSGQGTVLSCTYCFYASINEEEMEAFGDIPFVLAVIKLDEADTCFLHNVVARQRRVGVIKTGTRIHVAWKEKREGKVSDFYFVPDEDI